MDTEIKDALGQDLLALLDDIALVLNGIDVVRIITHYDADGICSASVLVKALKRMGKKYHVTFRKGLKDEFIQELNLEKNPCVVFLDMGSNNQDSINELTESGTRVIVLDHHRIQEKKEHEDILHLNCNLYNIDGMTQACASTLAFITALHLDKENWDMAGIYLAGCMGDKQHLKTFTGINDVIVKTGVARGTIVETQELNLYGSSLREGLTGGIEPLFLELESDPEAIDSFLGQLKMDPGMSIDELNDDDSVTLRSALALELMKQNVRTNVIERLVGTHYRVNGLDTRMLSYVIDSCGRMDKMGMGMLAAVSGGSSLEEGMKLYREYVEFLHRTLIRIHKEGRRDGGSFIYFYTKEEEGAIAGTLAELTLDYLSNGSKPVFALTKSGNEVRVSSRATKTLFSSGLDLSAVMHKAAEHVGGRGGGHPVASGATIPDTEDKDFLEKADSIIKFQLE